jgi:hypothetical protein
MAAWRLCVALALMLALGARAIYQEQLGEFDWCVRVLAREGTPER